MLKDYCLFRSLIFVGTVVSASPLSPELHGHIPLEMGSGSSAEAVEPKVTGGSGPEVILNVYEPTQGQSSVMGMGIFHTGIEVSGVEYAYGGGSVSASGVYTQTPRQAPPGSNWRFKMSQRLGKAKIPAAKIASALDKVREQFKADEYHVTGRNCNHFTEAAATALGVELNYPAWVNRAAKLGHTFNGGGGSQKPKEEPVKSVFETSEGHTLDGSAPAKKKAAAGATPTAGDNPWRQKGFKPPGMTTLEHEAPAK